MVISRSIQLFSCVYLMAQHHEFPRPLAHFPTVTASFQLLFVELVKVWCLRKSSAEQSKLSKHSLTAQITGHNVGSNYFYGTKGLQALYEMLSGVYKPNKWKIFETKLRFCEFVARPLKNLLQPFFTGILNTYFMWPFQFEIFIVDTAHYFCESWANFDAGICYRVFVLNVFNFLLNHFTLLTCSNFTRKREMNIVQFALLLFILFFRLLEVIAGKFCHDNDRSSQALYSKSVKLQKIV